MDTTNGHLLPEEASEEEKRRNDTANTGDDTIGENSELTPLAKEVLKDQDDAIYAQTHQENKDFSEKNG